MQQHAHTRELGREAAALFRPCAQAAGNAAAAAASFIRCRDPAEASARLRSAYSHHRLSVHGRRFDMRFECRRLGALELARLRFGTEVELDQQAAGGFTLITTQLEGASEIVAGGGVHRGGAGMVVLDSAATPVRKRFSADSCRLNLRIEQGLLAAKWAALSGQADAAPPLFQPALAAGLPAQARWLALLRLVLGWAQVAPGAALLRQLEEMVALYLLTEVPHSQSALLHRPLPAPAPRHLRRAEDYMRAHAGQPLTLADIATAAGVGIRTLSAAFRDSRGTSPMAWLRELRLEGARQDLLAAGPADTVAEIAIRRGFGNLGRFAADYRRRYGETPSATLRRGSY